MSAFTHVVGLVLAVFGIGLELYFNAMRFISEGVPILVAGASSIIVVLAFNAAFILRKRGIVLCIFAALVGMFSMMSTSASQSWAFGRVKAEASGADERVQEKRYDIDALKVDITQLDAEAQAHIRQRASAATLADLATYRTAIVTLDARLEEIAKRRAADLEQIRQASATLSGEAEAARPTVYCYYQVLFGIQADALQIIFHTALSLIITLSAPLGLLASQTQLLDVDVGKADILDEEDVLNAPDTPAYWKQR